MNLYLLFHYAYAWLRDQDSNLGPRGYEPRELPLLHPAKILSNLGLAKDIVYVTGVVLSTSSLKA